ncbi:AAA family ATPase [Demequina globuliformis]|uniref:AAA family ATPase n=1 Tax=Demequina globuliformis TaxID=676202 RepID=UPI000A59C0C9|nr:hypothetical protein [Demequina globuliformis]
MATTGVVVAVRHRAEAELTAAIDAHPALAVARRCADLAEAVAAVQAGAGAVMVVSDQPRLTRDVLADLARSGVALVGVAATDDEGQHLRTLGIHDVWAAPSAPALAQHLASLADQATPGVVERVTKHAHAGQGQAGHVYAVWGPAGAPGRTTVAVGLAAEFAARGYRTCVVDADTYGGAVAQATGMLDEAPGLAGVARAASTGRVDGDVLARHAVRLNSRLSVLSGISRPSRWPELPAPALDAVWDALRDWADITVIDTGFSLEHDEDLTYDTRAPQRNGATLSALTAADTVVAVGSAEPLGVQRLIHAWESLTALAPQPVVAMNRVRAEVAGPQPTQALADALTRYAGVDEAWMLPWDPRSADAATLAGQTLRERAPRGKLTKAMGALAGGVLGAAMVGAPARISDVAVPALGQ